MSPAPMRASDQDRDEAVRALADHYADGRLDHAEFEARMSAASGATYLHDLDPLFADLPSRTPPPSVEARRHPPVRRPGPWLAFAPFVVIAAIVTMVVLTHGRAMWLLFPLWWFGLLAARRRAWERRSVGWADAWPHGPHGVGRRRGSGWDG